MLSDLLSFKYAIQVKVPKKFNELVLCCLRVNFLLAENTSWHAKCITYPVDAHSTPYDSI